ncbi:low molecular weight protein-tyrosine-phosphatase [Micromonospora sp. M71_S20]|uniref:low molecular weight protein-tyrosine-phosphatase n=1 Tax=Micromonospora sp. M71_S20 TaxID=592872 RepID=UPI0018F3AE11|nr:low molecular weight protein-tyrosine-phosphatase [Micromonospora sp. M71_S20]
MVVCLGNHCRSPLAAAILATRGGDAVVVRSAALHAGRLVDQPAHPLMIEAATALGYDLTDHRGVQLTAAMLHWADTILAMDQSILTRLREQAHPDDQLKLRLYLPDADVPDPWEKTAADFTACAQLIDQGADQHLA